MIVPAADAALAVAYSPAHNLHNLIQFMFLYYTKKIHSRTQKEQRTSLLTKST